MKISEEFKNRLLSLEEEKEEVVLDDEPYYVLQIDEDNYYENFSGELVKLGYYLYVGKNPEEFDKRYFLYLEEKYGNSEEMFDLKFFKKEHSKTENNEAEEKNKPKIKGAQSLKNKKIKLMNIEIVQK